MNKFFKNYEEFQNYFYLIPELQNEQVIESQSQQQLMINENPELTFRQNTNVLENQVVSNEQGLLPENKSTTLQPSFQTQIFSTEEEKIQKQVRKKKVQKDKAKRKQAFKMKSIEEEEQQQIEENKQEDPNFSMTRDFSLSFEQFKEKFEAHDKY